MTARNSATPEQLGALRKYAHSHGRYWKSKLRWDWYRGTDEGQPDGGLLRQVRNDLGPTWLTKFKLGAAQ